MFFTVEHHLFIRGGACISSRVEPGCLPSLCRANMCVHVAFMGMFGGRLQTDLLPCSLLNRCDGPSVSARWDRWPPAALGDSPCGPFTPLRATCRQIRLPVMLPRGHRTFSRLPISPARSLV